MWSPPRTRTAVDSRSAAVHLFQFLNHMRTQRGRCTTQHTRNLGSASDRAGRIISLLREPAGPAELCLNCVPAQIQTSKPLSQDVHVSDRNIVGNPCCAADDLANCLGSCPRLTGDRRAQDNEKASDYLAELGCSTPGRD